jgi:hypothetical protein
MKTWQACDHGDYGDNGGECIAIICEDKRIALVLGPDTQETRKNADMISAAPEMLAALEALVGGNAMHSLCVHRGEDSFGRVMGTWSAEAQARAVAAIAKAKGEA